VNDDPTCCAVAGVIVNVDFPASIFPAANRIEFKSESVTARPLTPADDTVVVAVNAPNTRLVHATLVSPDAPVPADVCTPGVNFPTWDTPAEFAPVV